MVRVTDNYCVSARPKTASSYHPEESHAKFQPIRPSSFFYRVLVYKNVAAHFVIRVNL